MSRIAVPEPWPCPSGLLHVQTRHVALSVSEARESIPEVTAQSPLTGQGAQVPDAKLNSDFTCTTGSGRADSDSARQQLQIAADPALRLALPCPATSITVIANSSPLALSIQSHYHSSMLLRSARNAPPPTTSASKRPARRRNMPIKQAVTLPDDCLSLVASHCDADTLRNFRQTS